MTKTSESGELEGLATPEGNRVVLGEGCLDWQRKERQTGRWGTVNLFINPSEESEASANFETAPLSSYGVLIAEILETNPSPREGLLIREEFPRVGDVIVLGEGYLFKEEVGGVQNIGVRPDDEREDDWMYQRSLFRVHKQMVKLSFETIKL